MIILLGEPISTQNAYLQHGFIRFMKKKALALKASYIKQVKEQWEKPPLEGDVELDVRIYFGTKRKSDIDNFSKIFFDSLTGNVMIDDSQIRKMTIEKDYCKERPRIEFEIYGYNKRL